MKSSVQKKKIKIKKEVKVVQTEKQLTEYFSKNREQLRENSKMACRVVMESVGLGGFARQIFRNKEEADNDPDFTLPPDAWIPKSSACSASGGCCNGDVETGLTQLPFEIPEHAKDSIKINRILRYSLKKQLEEEVFENPAVVTTLVSRCLAAVDVDNKVVYGYRTMPQPSETSPTHNGCGESGCDTNYMWRPPHVWLVSGKFIIDNTYKDDMPEECYEYLRNNTAKCYEETTYSHSSSSASKDKACNTDEKKAKSDAQQVRAIMEKRIEFCMNHPDKALALCHNIEQFYNYFFAMIRFMYEEFSVTISGIDPNIRLCCWWCNSFPEKGQDLYSDTLCARLAELPLTAEREEDKSHVSYVSSESKNSWRLLQCSQCMVANYCSQTCQEQDWADNHSSTCLPRSCVMPISDVSYNGAL